MSAEAGVLTYEALEPENASDEAGRSELAAAVRLGWRLAELYARADDPGDELANEDTMLPSHDSFSPDDQLELQLNAAAGDARRAGIAVREELVARLKRSAAGAATSPARTRRFRGEVSGFHVELSKALWARDESTGKAYELGNGLSDTYGRIRRAYRSPQADARDTWSAVFDGERIERLKKLLDDLESRLDPAGVAVVRQHLDAWCKRVGEWTEVKGPLPKRDVVCEELRRQTVVWRQLIAGDKTPEAYLNSDARAELRGDLRQLMWERSRRFVVWAVAALVPLAFCMPYVIEWYGDGGFHVGAAAGSVILAVAGALGITKASMLAALRTQAHRWSEMLWNRVVVAKVSQRTLYVEEVIPATAADVRQTGTAATAVRAAPGWARAPLQRLRSAA